MNAKSPALLMAEARMAQAVQAKQRFDNFPRRVWDAPGDTWVELKQGYLNAEINAARAAVRLAACEQEIAEGLANEYLGGRNGT